MMTGRTRITDLRANLPVLHVGGYADSRIESEVLSGYQLVWVFYKPETKLQAARGVRRKPISRVAIEERLLERRRQMHDERVAWWRQHNCARGCNRCMPATARC